jgi:hypothetical protein
MDPLTLLVDILIVLWFGAVLVAIARAWNARRPRLTPISPQAYDRFTVAWDRIAAEFVQAPSSATREAEDLVYNLLAARGHPTNLERLPEPMIEARRWTAREPEDGTTALRQAMLHYRIVFDRIIGRRPSDEPVRPGRREVT